MAPSKIMAALLVSALLTGCSAPATQTGSGSDRAEPPAASPAASAPLAAANAPAVPSPDTTTASVTATSPSPQPSTPTRRQIGEWNGVRYFVDVYKDRLEILGAPAQLPPERIATIAIAYKASNPPPSPPDIWARLSPAGLTILIGPAGEQSHLYQIDPLTGAVADLGVLGSPPVRLSLDLSHDGRYLAEKRLGIALPLEIIDLKTGKRTSYGDEAIPMGGFWSPSDLTVAVRAAESGSGLPAQIGAMYGDGGTHIDLIGVDGSSRKLQPPQALQLTRGPVWSPDGKWLAVYSGSILPIGQGPNGASVFESRSVWVVEAATNRWVFAGDLLAGADPNLTQWDDKWSAWLSRLAAKSKP